MIKLKKFLTIADLWNSITEESAIKEADEALKKKSEKSGISYGTLKKVYNRGVAAWKSGHRKLGLHLNSGDMPELMPL